MSNGPSPTATADSSSVPASRSAPRWSNVAAVLAGASDLAACDDVELMLKRAVEFARDRIGLERVGLYMRDPRYSGAVLRGTWGTGRALETVDERQLHHECSQDDQESLRTLYHRGSLWMLHERVPQRLREDDKDVVLGHGWLAVTPLVCARELVGVMYNDSAVSRAAVDEGKQACVAVLGGVLGSLFLARRGRMCWKPLRHPDNAHPAVRQALASLQLDPTITGHRLSRELGISPGHLARSFKAGLGMSLVEYRNRLRLEIFFDNWNRRGGNLLAVALDSGFGSYAHFHRAFRSVLGVAPREYLATGSGRPPRLIDLR